MQKFRYIRVLKTWYTLKIKKTIWKKRWSWINGSVMILLAIIAEAMQSHALEGISDEKVANYLTATRFMFFNGLALIAVHLLHQRHRSNPLLYAGRLILAVTVLFSFTVIIKVFVSMGSLGVITPLGGMVLIAGWLLMNSAAFRAKY